MNLESSLRKLVQLEKEGKFQNLSDFQTEMDKVLIAYSGRIDFLEQDDDESDHEFETRVQQVLPIIFQILKEKNECRYTKVAFAFFYMDASLLFRTVPYKDQFLIVWMIWLVWETPKNLALWHSDQSINSQYLECLDGHVNDETRKSFADQLVSKAKTSSENEIWRILVSFAKSISPIDVPDSMPRRSNYNKLIDAISFNPNLVSYFERFAPDLLEQDYVWIYSYMSKELDWDNSCRLIFTPKEAVFVPSNWAGKLFKKSEPISRRDISYFRSCSIGDQHNTFNYGFTGQDESYYFSLFWTMKNGNVFQTRTFAGMDMASAKTSFNQTIAPMARSLSPFMEFSLDGGHSETYSGSNMRISYGVWF